MNCILKMELITELNQAQAALERLDSFFKERHTSDTELTLNPPEAFMSAWNKVKTARQTLLTINLENESVL